MNTILMVMSFASFLVAMAIRFSSQALISALLGDGSPVQDRRLSLDPRRHLAPLGTVVAITLSFATSGIPVGFGWGRLVRPNVHRFSINKDAGLILIGLGGILSNLVIGFLLALLLRFIPNPASQNLLENCSASFGGVLQGCLSPWQAGGTLRIEQFIYVLASVNVLVGLLNFVPLYPLDGYHILYALLPAKQATSYRRNEGTQELILLLFLFLIPLLLSFTASVSFNPIRWLDGLSISIIELIAGTHTFPLFDIFFRL